LGECGGVFELTEVEGLVECFAFLWGRLLLEFLLVCKVVLEVGNEGALLLPPNVDFVELLMRLVLLLPPRLALHLLLLLLPGLRPNIRAIPALSPSDPAFLLPVILILLVLRSSVLFFLNFPQLSLPDLLRLPFQLPPQVELLFLGRSESLEAVALHVLVVDLARAVFILKVG
jgi:hypothetical protein